MSLINVDAENMIKKDFSAYFEELASVRAEGTVPVVKYRSKRTGITVFVADIEGPLVHGYCYLATEAHDDDGLPHTLEHLIFLGSELYPYKGVLDLAANRCLASGTNAWTDVDHTCYTMTTAGAEGFLQLLPIYLDHILYPLLKDAAFITEVHHVNGDGEDAGVVYCEMQGRENVDDCLAHLMLIRAMYPEPSGYRCQTGGIMKNLRESTTNEKVRNYHSTYYRPENLGLVIAGRVRHEDLLSVLQIFEDRILTKPKRPEFVRPWQTPVPPLLESVDQTVLFPSDEETNGLVLTSWRGPHSKEVEVIVTLTTLLEYLCSTAIAPLHKEFVEQVDPYCSRITFGALINLETCYYFVFEDVPKSKLGLIKEKLLACLLAIGNGSEPFDLKRMQTLLHRRSLDIASTMESDAHQIITNELIDDFLYGNEGQDFEKNLNQIQILQHAVNKPAEYWLGLLNKYFNGKNFVLIRADPSKEHMEVSSKLEEERIAKQRELLKEEGLKLKADMLKRATEENEIPPPDGMIQKIPVPDVKKIEFLSLSQSSNHPTKDQTNPNFPVDELPVCFLVDNVKSNFVQLNALLNTANVPMELRFYLPLFCEVLLESPILRGKELISHDIVIAQMLEDVVRSRVNIGINACGGSSIAPSGPYLQGMALCLTLDMKRYVRGVNWLRELLFFTQFTVDRLRIVVNKMISVISRMKRQGGTVTQCILDEMSYGKDSNKYACNMMRQQNFLNRTLATLDSESSFQIIEDLNKLRSLITDPDNITIYMATDTEKLATIANVADPWKEFLPEGNNSKPKHTMCFAGVKSNGEMLMPTKICRFTKAVVGVGSVESSFLVQCAPCSLTYIDPDLPAVCVLLQYLTQLEGPMWRQIRGLGLAYGFGLGVEPDEGLITLFLYECSHVVSAFREAKTIIENYIGGKESWKDDLLDSARSSLIFEIIEQERNIQGLCNLSLLSHFRKIDSQYNRRLVKKISEVTIEDLKRVGPKYVADILNPEFTRSAVCCHPSKVDEVVAGFKDLNQSMEIIPLEEGCMCELK